VSRAFSVFLASRPDLRSVLEGLRWSRLSAEEASSEGVEQFHRESREWFADAWGPSPMSWEDAPPGATALQAGIAWHVAVSLEGSEAGLREVMRAVNAIARSGAGVIADEGDVWKPGQRRRDARWSSAVERPSAETELLRMIWWTIGVNPFSDKGAQSLVAILQRVLPEAIPVRWGQLEPYSHNLEAEGMRGLADFIANRSDGRFMARSDPRSTTSLSGRPGGHMNLARSEFLVQRTSPRGLSTLRLGDRSSERQDGSINWQWHSERSPW
jgi:hypothetical protein